MQAPSISRVVGERHALLLCQPPQVRYTKAYVVLHAQSCSMICNSCSKSISLKLLSRIITNSLVPIIQAPCDIRYHLGQPRKDAIHSTSRSCCSQFTNRVAFWKRDANNQRKSVIDPPRAVRKRKKKDSPRFCAIAAKVTPAIASHTTVVIHKANVLE